MRLSEAIRKGSAGIKQTHWEYFAPAGAACAVGAAVRHLCESKSIPIGIDVAEQYADAGMEDELRYLVMEACGIPQYEHIDCPECPDRGGGVVSMVIHMNDDHAYSFEEIAEYLERHKL